MRKQTVFAVLAAAAVAWLPAAALAQGWTGTGEVGIAASRGNARSENINAKLAFAFEDARWKHDFHAAVLRAKGEVAGDFDGDGVPEERFELSANRYELGASSGFKTGERSRWLAAVRYENDDFAPYSSQATVSVGYGYTFTDTEQTGLSVEIGPGYRRAELAGSGETESGLIARGKLDWRHALTATTALTNVLLVEAGSDNTFAQDDFGVAVAMNERFALKAGLQVRHNTDVEPGIKRTDSLVTVNLVYTFQ